MFALAGRALNYVTSGDAAQNIYRRWRCGTWSYRARWRVLGRGLPVENVVGARSSVSNLSPTTQSCESETKRAGSPARRDPTTTNAAVGSIASVNIKASPRDACIQLTALGLPTPRSFLYKWRLCLPRFLPCSHVAVLCSASSSAVPRARLSPFDLSAAAPLLIHAVSSADWIFYGFDESVSERVENFVFPRDLFPLGLHLISVPVRVLRRAKDL
ncbi:hypothetical protein MUK42_35315 [Musa troglodytarum]|uniref:Uncharacterized protein n=1 Tax=Musa troglodytarum TaxID=320322 RepID=A0A9E7JB85_9LILI|nr:hypothetical protein MUK42_35315 [Musa troglodytarum]